MIYIITNKYPLFLNKASFFIKNKFTKLWAFGMGRTVGGGS